MADLHGLQEAVEKPPPPKIKAAKPAAPKAKPGKGGGAAKMLTQAVGLVMSMLTVLARASCPPCQATGYRHYMACPAEETAVRADGVAVDSGASLPIVNSSSTEYQVAPAEADVILDTVQGMTHVDQGSWVRFPLLDGLHKALKLPNSPNCASLGRLVEDLGYRFWWEKGQCWLGHPNGTWTQLAIHNYVPFLEPPLEPGSDSEYSAIVNWCVSCLGEDNPVLNNVLQDLAQTWPEYTAFVADARRRRATQKGPQPGPPGAAPGADAQAVRLLGLLPRSHR